MNDPTEPLDYKKEKDLSLAVEICKLIEETVLDKYGSEDITIVHLAACIWETYCTTAIPNCTARDVLIDSARALAVPIVNQIIEEKQLDKGIFTVPGNNEVN